jgi:DNA-binding transcriptional ArsR family regulator
MFATAATAAIAAYREVLVGVAILPDRGATQLDRSSADARCIGDLYALTGIYVFQYIDAMGSAFDIIAEPNRRAILSLLAVSERSVGEIERQLRMTQPTVSKHLRVLRDAGFVESRVDAQRRLYRLKPESLREVEAWLAPFRRFWLKHVDALEQHLDRMEKASSMKGKTRHERS